MVSFINQRGNVRHSCLCLHSTDCPGVEYAITDSICSSDTTYNHGYCVLSTSDPSQPPHLTCSCNAGYVGEDCSLGTIHNPFSERDMERFPKDPYLAQKTDYELTQQACPGVQNNSICNQNGQCQPAGSSTHCVSFQAQISYEHRFVTRDIMVRIAV